MGRDLQRPAEGAEGSSRPQGREVNAAGHLGIGLHGLEPAPQHTSRSGIETLRGLVIADSDPDQAQMKIPELIGRIVENFLDFLVGFKVVAGIELARGSQNRCSYRI